MLYDFKCPHGHLFEHMCRMADRLKIIPCEGKVNQLVEDELYDKYAVGDEELPQDLFWESLEEGDLPDGMDGSVTGNRVLMRKVPCQLSAKIHVGTHSNPGAFLDHGSAANRDAAREGRYDPMNPNTRFMTKGRSWRK